MNLKELELYDLVEYLRDNNLSLKSIELSQLNKEAYADLIKYWEWADKYNLDKDDLNNLYLFVMKDDMGFWHQDLRDAINEGFLTDNQLKAIGWCE